MTTSAPAKDRLLDAAEDLFLARGYAATSLDQLCAQAGVTKGGLFYHFDSKEQLAQAAVTRFFARLVEAGQAATGSSEPADPVEALFAYVDATIELATAAELQNGCLLGAMALETPGSHPLVADAADTALAEWRERTARLIGDAAAHRGVEVSADELAGLYLAAVEGGLLLDRSRAANETATAALTHYAAYLRLLLDPKGSA